MRTCERCAAEISPERLEALPNTSTCTACSTVRKAVTYMDYGHKTAPSLVVIESTNTEAVRRAQRAFTRAR